MKVNFTVVPILQLDMDQVQEYWQKLYMDGYLDYRLCNVENPMWSDVMDMIRIHGNKMFHVLVDGKIIAEFMMDNFTGKAAQVHFSMHPDNDLKLSLYICTTVSDNILNTGHITSLFGLTPVSNRRACIFVQKCGFKKVATLPGGIEDRGQIVDAMITIKSGVE